MPDRIRILMIFKGVRPVVDRVEGCLVRLRPWDLRLGWEVRSHRLGQEVEGCMERLMILMPGEGMGTDTVEVSEEVG